MSAQPRHKFTPKEYLAFERNSEERHEYLDGDIFAMVGASERHGWIVSNTLAGLHPQLVKQGCRIYSESLRVRARKTKGYFYPDIVIVCGEREFEDDQLDTLTNPTVLVEVLSPSTMKYDRNEKWLKYQRIDSLQAYVMIYQDAPLIDLFTRMGDAWEWRRIEGLDAVLEISPVQGSLRFAQIYDGLDFDPLSDDDL